MQTQVAKRTKPTKAKVLRVRALAEADALVREEEALVAPIAPWGLTADERAEVVADGAAPIVELSGEPAPEPETAPPDLELRVPTAVDIDRLWDWIRVDGSDFQAALHVSTSIDLHAKLQVLIDMEARGEAFIRALVWQERHVGFITLMPILDHVGCVHVYLDKAVRGHGLPILRATRAALKSERPDLALSAVTDRPKVVSLARRLGFLRVQYVLTEQ